MMSLFTIKDIFTDRLQKALEKMKEQGGTSVCFYRCPGILEPVDRSELITVSRSDIVVELRQRGFRATEDLDVIPGRS